MKRYHSKHAEVVGQEYTLPEETLFDAITELQGSRDISNMLEELCNMLNNRKKFSLYNERGILVFQLENVQL